MCCNIRSRPLARCGRATWSSIATRSTRRVSSSISSPFGRGGDCCSGELRQHPRKGDRWSGRRKQSSSPAPATRWAARKGHGQFGRRHVRRAVPAFHLPQAVRFNQALALGARSAFRRQPIKPDDIAFLQYTGGTTGVPKGAMLTHRNMIANLRQIHAWLAPAIGAGGRNLRRCVAALSCVCAASERLPAADDWRVQPPDRQSARHSGARQGPAGDAVHRASRRQHAVQRAAQQRGLRQARFLASASFASAAAWRCSARSPSAGRP